MTNGQGKDLDRKITNSRLSDISDAIESASERRHREQIEHNAALEAQGAIKFVPDQEDEIAARGFGMGYFQIGNYLLAYRRYANGYEMYPCMTIEAQLVKELAEKLV